MNLVGSTLLVEDTGLRAQAEGRDQVGNLDGVRARFGKSYIGEPDVIAESVFSPSAGRVAARGCPKNGKYAYDVMDNTDSTALGVTAPLGRMNQ